MTNRTIDQDARVILAAVAGLQYSAFRADPDAARMRILHALTSMPTAPLPETKRYPDGNDRQQAIPPLGVATTYHWTAQATSRMGSKVWNDYSALTPRPKS
jgi:hypothetical protein